MKNDSYYNFKEIKVADLTDNIFDLIGSEWMLIGAAKNDGTFNMMTASWGSAGIMWGMPILNCVVRNTRYTYEFTEASPNAAFSFFGDDCRKQLSHLGSKSGRDVDKQRDSDLTPIIEGGIVWFSEARLVIFGRKLYFHDIAPQGFTVDDLCEKNYPNKDYHRMYTYEIEKIILRK